MKDRIVSLPKIKEKDTKLEREKAIIQAYQKGLSQNRIEVEFHISPQTIKKIFIKHKVKQRDQDWQKRACAELLKTGDYSVKKMCDKLNLKNDSVRASIPYWGFSRYICECGTNYIYTLNPKKK